MARPSALLLAAVVLLAAVCSQYTAQAALADFTKREIPVFVTVAGTTLEYSAYTKLQQFCNLMKANTTASISVCEIFSVAPASVANSVDIGAYFLTTVDSNPAAVASLITSAFPEGANFGGTGFIRTAAARAGTPKNPAATPPTGDAPVRFTTQRMRLRIFYRGQQTASPTTSLKGADLVSKLTGTELILSATLDTTGSVDVDVTVDGGTLHMAEVNVQGYYEDRRTMMDAIRTRLQDATTPGQFFIVEMIDVTHAATPEYTANSMAIVGYDAQSSDDPTQIPYRLTISFTSSADATAATTATAADAFKNAVFDALYPLNQYQIAVATATAGTPATTSVIPVTLFATSSADVLRILQFFSDAISSGNTTRTTFGAVALNGIRSYTTVSRTDSRRGDSFRIPQADFPLQQRYRFGLDVLQSFLNSSVAVNEVCAQVLRRTAGVTACYIERITVGAPAPNQNANGLVVPAKRRFETLAADGQVYIVVNASDVLAALRMKFNVQNSLRAGVVSSTNFTLNFTDPNGPNSAAVVREELWTPRQQTHTMYINLNIAGTTNYAVIGTVDSFQKRIGLFYVGGSALFNPYGITGANGLEYSRSQIRYYLGKNDITTAITPATGLNYRIWAVGPKAVTPSALRLELLLRAGVDFAGAKTISNGAVTISGNSTGFGEAYAVTPTITVNSPSNLIYINSLAGLESTQTNFEDAAAALFSGQTSTVFDAASTTVTNTNEFFAPVKYFALTPAPIVSIVGQQFIALNSSRTSIGTFTVRSPVVSSTVLQPELAFSLFPAVPAAPAPASPPGTAVVPVSAPAAPVAPSAIAPGSINGFRVGVDLYLITPPAVNASALCAAILAQGSGAPYFIRTCAVIFVSNDNATLPTQGAKFEQQGITRVVLELTTDSSASANALINNLITGINNKSFLRGFNIADVNLVTLQPAPVPAPSGFPSPAPGPGLAVAPATNGSFTTVDIYIVILGTALDAVAQAALNNECGSFLGGGATCLTKNIEQTTAARKMTTQASALRLTETVRAPAATYPSANTIVARLQSQIRANNGRLGGQQVVLVSTIGNGSSAAARTTPALLAFLAAVLVAVLSAMMQF